MPANHSVKNRYLVSKSPKRGSMLWRNLKKGMPMYLGHRRRFHKPRPPRFLIDPDTKLKRIWDFVLSTCVLYTTVVVPYRVCFRREAAGGFSVLESIMDVGFGTDIVLNFFTGVYLSSGEVSFNHRIIIRSYLRGWFVIDLFSTMPFDLLAKWFGVGDNAPAALLSTKLLRGLKVLRLFKLARIQRLGRIFSKLEDAVYTNQSLLSLAKLALVMLFVAHLVACVWYAVGLQNSKSSWIILAGYDQENIPDIHLLQYVGSVYWALVTMATIGYGDIVAQNNTERLVNIAVMAIGVSFFGYIIGTISTLVTNLNVSAARYDEHMTLVKEYIQSRRMPKHMSNRIRDHFEYYYQNRSVFDERKILKRLPSALRNEMIHHVYSKFISSIKYFESCHESLISDIVMAMKPFSVLKDEYVYVQHEIAAHVFFLLKGKISLIKTLPGTGEEKKLASLNIGDHFGEMEVYDHTHGNGIRICSAVAKAYCELTFLSRKAIAKIGDNWPEVLKHFKESSLAASAAMIRRAGAATLSSPTQQQPSMFRAEEEMTQVIQKSSAIATRIMRDNRRGTHRVTPITDDTESSSRKIISNAGRRASAAVDKRPAPVHINSNGDNQAGDRTELSLHAQPLEPIQPQMTPLGNMFPSLRGKRIVLEALPSSPMPGGSRRLSAPVFDSMSKGSSGAWSRGFVKDDDPGDSSSIPVPMDDTSSVSHIDKPPSPTPVENPDPAPPYESAIESKVTTAPDAPTSQMEQPVAENEDAKHEPTPSEAENQEQLSNMIAKIRDSAVARPKQNFSSERNQLKGTRLFHPQEPFILTWQFIIGIGIVYSIIVVPLRLGFNYDATGGWYILEFVIDGFFMVDIALNFCTAFFDEERLLIYDRRVIFWRYARGWFLSDFVSTMPIDELVRGIAGSQADVVKVFPTKLLRLLRIVRLLKLARLIKLSRVFGKVRDTIQLSPSTERLLKLLTMMTMVCHWNACLFHAVMLASEGSLYSNWCVEAFFPPDAKLSGDCSSLVPLVDRYVTALYWAFTTLTTVGYGDIKPSIFSVYELLMVIILIVFDATMFGYIISSVITLIRDLNPSDREFKLLMTEMKDYLRDSAASGRLCTNVKTHYKHNIACTSLFPEQKIFGRMYPSLRYDIGRLVAGESLFAIPLITVMEDSFKGFVSYALFLLTPLSIRRGEKVCQSGGPGTEMFFMVEGECDLINSQTGAGRIIAENAVFEQYALMTRPDEIYRTVSTVTAISRKCILYSLSIQDFRKLEEVSPAVSTYFLSQLASVLVEDGMFTLSAEQKMNVHSVLRQGQNFRAVAEKTNRHTLLKDLGRVAMANLHNVRRGSEWSPDLLPKQLQLLDELAAAGCVPGRPGEGDTVIAPATNATTAAATTTVTDAATSVASTHERRPLSSRCSSNVGPAEHAVHPIRAEESVGE